LKFRAMNRTELETLSAQQLQQLIADAAAVLAARCASAPTMAVGSGLFTFGSNEQTSHSGGAGGCGLFAPPVREPVKTCGGLFVGSSAVSSGSSLFRGSTAPSTAGSDTGLGKLFGGTGGGLFGGVASAVKAVASQDGGEDEGEDEGESLVKEEEEVTAVYGWTPSITLEITEHLETGEEGEEELYVQRSKLYRFKDEEWKERGLGEARLLKDTATGRVRFLLRQERTGKVVANHYVLDHGPYCDLRPNAQSDKTWVWCAQDYADGKLEVERLALRFGTSDLANRFKEAFEDAKCRNAEAQNTQRTTLAS